jgi:3-oxoacyl-[acyl-carrier protein] reductase
MTTTRTDHSTGRVVVITGAAGGVGAALVDRFLRNGDRVIATDLSATALDKLRADLGTTESLVTVAGSIADEDDVRATRPGRSTCVLTPTPRSRPRSTATSPPFRCVPSS